jgi:hypothetical protein
MGECVASAGVVCTRRFRCRSDGSEAHALSSVHRKHPWRGRGRCVHAWRVHAWRVNLKAWSEYHAQHRGRSRSRRSRCRSEFQGHVRWVACTVSSCGEGGRDVRVHGERRRDTDDTRCADAGLDRGVLDAAAMFQRNVHWLACTESSCADGGRNVCMLGERRHWHDTDVTRSTEASRDSYRTKFPNSVAFCVTVGSVSS